jgi:hypothetical protein
LRLYNIRGRLINKNVSKHLIDWKKKSRSNLQFKVKQFLKPFWEKHVVYEEFPVFGTRMKVDIVNVTKYIAVEVNGQQHGSFNKFFHNNSRYNYFQSLNRDWKKEEWLEKNSFQVIVIEYNEVDFLTEEFIKEKFDISI